MQACNFQKLKQSKTPKENQETPVRKKVVTARNSQIKISNGGTDEISSGW